MMRHMIVGIPVILACLLLQAVFVTYCVRRFAQFRLAHRDEFSWLLEYSVLACVVLLMLFGNIVQIAIWGALFMALGEFDSFPVAIYHSGVNYAGLGYGDIVMSERWRTLGPLEAANGILMFGLSTAVMTGAVMEIIKNVKPRRSDKELPRQD